MRQFSTRVLVSISLLSGALWAEPAFEVASVKTSSIPGPENVDTKPGSLNMRNISLRRAISWAWDTPRGQISGPEWLPDEHFDISAKAATAAPIDEMRLMLRTLLTERLGVRVHEEKRETSVYFLTLAKNGPRLHEPSGKDQTKFAESVGEAPPHFGRNRTMLVADHVSTPDIAEQLSDPLQRPVIDRTGLKGVYDIILDPSAYLTTETDGKAERVDPITMILMAIPQQLGLKVESGKDSVRFLIVDAASRTPTPN
jgi:uncharacterized protein (TIGR03435 family)